MTTKIKSGVIGDNVVGITQLNVSDGTNGQVLITDGAGTLSFSTISGYTDSDVETYLNTSEIYTDATNDRLGIGTASPQKALNVFADNTAPVRFERNTSDGQVIQIYKDGSAVSSIGTNSTGIGNSLPQAGLDLGSSAKGTWSSGNVYSYPTGNAYIKIQ